MRRQFLAARGSDGFAGPPDPGFVHTGRGDARPESRRALEKPHHV
jgi:hypothetical protein